MQKELIDKYIDVIFEIGLALRRGDRLHIAAEASEHETVCRMVSRAYELGAREVTVEWQSAKTEALRLSHADPKEDTLYPAWQKVRCDELLDSGACYLLNDSPFADGETEVSSEALAEYNREKSLARARYNAAILSFGVRYTVAALPNREWAKRVFPGMDIEEALSKLYDAVLRSCYIDRADPIGHWRSKQAEALHQCGYMTSAQFDALHIVGGGTDLTVGLIDRHRWLAGGVYASDGRYFLPNIPSEECASVPHRERTEGIVYTTKPLVYGGVVIDSIWLRFERGRVVGFGASAGEDALRSLLDTDEASRSLGEVAIVSADAIIGQTGLIYYAALFDENAACHIALGEGFPSLVEDGENATREEQLALGINRSSIHVDLMIGSSATSIFGIKHGVETEIFRNGRWVI